MITEIPTTEEFAQSGLNLLNLAWSMAMDIFGEFEAANVDDWDTDGEATDYYWDASQPALGNALALVQQAQEMALKGKIAAVSPYLLIARDFRDWPRRCDSEDKPFSMFRTVDAADLVKIHNAVCLPSLRLDKEFANFFDKVRRERNAIIHVGASRRRVAVDDLIQMILQTNKYLYPDANWFVRRRTYLESDRVAIAYSNKGIEYEIVHEFEAAVQMLKPSHRREFLGLTRARRYLCPECHNDVSRFTGEIIPVAQLRPNSPSASIVHCLVCEKDTNVVREKCASTSCNSNVICADPSWGPICLVCGNEQDERA